MGAEPCSSEPARSRAALVGVFAGLAVANALRTYVVPSDHHLAWNVATCIGVLAVGAWAGLAASDLGLARSHVRRGLRFGAAAFGVVALAIALAGLIPFSAGLLVDDRADVGVGSMLLRSLVIIPVGTVLVEELVFRGVVHALLLRVMALRTAIVVGAGVFGLWHVLPVIRRAVDEGTTPVPIALGTFAATAVAGAVFVWLRHRSSSLVAPALAHTASNSVAFAVAWAVS